ncbi:MAG: 50S ribosomal protein L10 [Candidatus Bathyarchaeota archaeon]|nr:MAG: 50S ribosomal protein L10 [Candidatus Bathyarchaeota archaeon]
MQVSEIPQWKIERVEAISKMALEYPVIAIGNLNKIRASQIQSLRKSLRDEVTFLVTKNNLIKRALNRVEKERPNIGELVERIEGSNLIIFTKMNPFRLLLLLENNKTLLTAKVGDIAPEDIVISAGNTGMPPGPVISDFTEVGVRTRIESGSVWVIQDTVVAKKGDPISLKLASMLSKMGIKPIESSLSIYVAYDQGTVIPSESLKIDVEGFKKDLLEAEQNALNLALFAWYPTAKNIGGMFRKAVAQAKSLGVSSFYIDKDFIPDLLRQSNNQALSLESHVD